MASTLLPSSSLLPEDDVLPGSRTEGTPDLSSVRPSVEDIGRLLNRRTYVMGTAQGTFNAYTEPTGVQVEQLISLAIGDMASRLGDTIGDLNDSDARRLVALQTACLVEASFFPDSLDSDRSAYRQYQAMYLTGVERTSGLNEQVAII